MNDCVCLYGIKNITFFGGGNFYVLIIIEKSCLFLTEMPDLGNGTLTDIFRKAKLLFVCHFYRKKSLFRNCMLLRSPVSAKLDQF